ncbi:FAD-binding oxidoreductase [Aeromicrobium sp. CFBP 8757]|uniref:NAD(P)/FAD-dependent oxidoreductase n=1 Tax=Aeromicrobium sp. CFBP 8757 TaxID=2775288 RepID=UPI00177DA950|nr:FAD-binding oxidoreductase [Aeromicrobium sp. CFBP 8757]MBD8606807.1 FAD-binding oxidoreductase [Aeromicrobium sp. CFBP 8757]
MQEGTPAPEVFDVVVIGGGATGAATAYYASRDGARVLLLDRNDLNTEASGRNAGSLHGQIQHEPFLHMGDDWARDWLPALAFLADSLAVWDGLSAELGVDLEVKKKGGLLLADRLDQLPDIERKVAFERSIGIDSRMMTRDEVVALAPWVSDEVVGGELCPIEGKANPLLTAPAFARAAMRHGATVRTGLSVSGLERTSGGLHRVVTTDGSFDTRSVVICTGDTMPVFGEMLGINLPVTSEAVQVSVTERIEPLVDHLVYYAGGKLTFKQATTGTLLIGGGWPARRDADGAWVLNPDSLRENLAIAVRIAPTISSVKLLRTWVGVGNGTPDQRPILGEVPSHPGVFVGIYPYMGFTASPLMGQTLAALAAGRDPGRDLTPFDPLRFS